MFIGGMVVRLLITFFKVIPNNELNKWHFFYGLKGQLKNLVELTVQL